MNLNCIRNTNPLLLTSTYSTFYHPKEWVFLPNFPGWNTVILRSTSPLPFLIMLFVKVSKKNSWKHITSTTHPLKPTLMMALLLGHSFPHIPTHNFTIHQHIISPPLSSCSPPTTLFYLRYTTIITPPLCASIGNLLSPQSNFTQMSSPLAS